MAKQKRPTLVTPRCVASYPHLTTPDTKFKEDGEYHVKGRFTGEGEAAMRASLDAAYAEAQVAAKKELAEAGKKGKVKAGPLPYTELEDGEGIEVNFKMKASGTKDGKRWQRRPVIYDAAGQPVPEGLKVGGGSILKIAYAMNPYYTALLGAGVSCWLEAVQVIELVPWGERDAASFGFSEEEGGFSAENAGSSLFAGSPDKGDSDIDPAEDEGDEEDDDGEDF